jgi:hypothetical protein
MFKEKRIIVNTEVDNTKTSLILWKPDQVPSSKIITFSVEILTPPQTILPEVINDINHCDGKLK